jgi:hypothetical protein
VKQVRGSQHSLGTFDRGLRAVKHSKKETLLGTVKNVDFMLITWCIYSLIFFSLKI